MRPNQFRLIVAPYHVGQPGVRVGGGPRFLLDHGIASELERYAPVTFSNIAPVDEFEGEMGKTFEVLRRISKAVSSAVAERAFPIVLSGNCSASAAVVAGLKEQGVEPGVLWFDAHDDLDIPERHTSGYLDGMAASMMCGMSWQAGMETVQGHKPTPLDRIALVGVRDISEWKRDWIKRQGLKVIWGRTDSKTDYTTELRKILDHELFKSSHVHLDVDVLDDSLGRANEWPSPGGITAEELRESMELIPQKVEPTSLVICSFDPRLEGGDSIARLVIRSVSQFARGLVAKGYVELQVEN